MKKEMTVRTVEIENHLDAEQVAGFLRALADELEGKEAGGLQRYGIDLHAFNKLKLGLRRGETGELFLKIKVKDQQLRQQKPGPAKKGKAGEEDPGRSEYKILKKRLKAAFVALGKTIDAGELPDGFAVQSFLQDSEKMTAWPGYGDPYYDEYNRLCTALRQASRARDHGQLQQCYRDLSACMKRCHAQFKK